MSELTEAERYLIQRVREGDADSWSQLVHRYQGRLLAFAHGRVRRSADAEDLVQETFLSFLKGLPDFRAEANVETYLFTILRRRIVDAMRGRKFNVCLLQDVLHGERGGSSRDGLDSLAGDEPTASWYARRDESGLLRRRALAAALAELVEPMKQSEDFGELEVVEMLFYCQLPNKEVARLSGLTENAVALIKHRCLKQVRERVAPRVADADRGSPGHNGGHDQDALLTAVWEEHRFSCPKRSTVGAYLLGSLEGAWKSYVDFHLNRLGCRFCQANLEDLRLQGAPRRVKSLQERIMQSTAGFLRRG
ncbi:MAG: RNA polymerase sigma factor [Phycisphaerae bacterium]